MIVETVELGFPWPTLDPFLFCAYHLDEYPTGTDTMGPEPALLRGRAIGSDFEVRDGWRMYHGDVVPGFPRHPHRGFETVTVVRQGVLDHSDSLGATARFGRGDCQWMTAGRGIVHSEMFPLLDREAGNTAELYQLWLNLPARNKMVEPAFTMMWDANIPKVTLRDANERETVVTVNAGSLEGRVAPAPPQHSWAADPNANVAIWTLEMQPGAEVTLPPAASDAHRMLYFHRGQRVQIGDGAIDVNRAALVVSDAPLKLRNLGELPADLLLLQGRPIGEPVAQHGPFVMNSQDEIRQAFSDYRRTQFGGWPWKGDGPVHARGQGRFAIHADGRREEAPRS